MQPLWGKGEVTLHDFDLVSRVKANRDYMMSLSFDNLMRNYMFEAGRYSAASIQEGIHGGWESPTCQLRGHFTGHWLSAAAMHYYCTGDGEVKARAEAMVDELAKCQADNGGQWAASIPEKYLHWIAGGLKSGVPRKGVWAPHYTIHKTFMGLLDMAQLAGCKQALEVAEAFAGWFLRWIDKFTKEEFDDILDVETGGMLEAWAQLLELTGNEVYKKLIDKYYRGRLFDALLEGGDPLTNMHANTTIPEILGCARAYDVTKEKRWRDIAEAYWKCAVADRGQYATGGQTCGEIWTPARQLDKRLGDKNQEYCTVYNMMRLAEYLFMWTGDAKYADYREQNLYNGIMAQSYWQNGYAQTFSSGSPKSGLLTYFLPMAPGSRKAWASETQDFFCCHGTLVQSNALHGRGIYYQDNDNLYICQYFDSTAEISIAGQTMRLTQKRDTLAGSFHFDSASQGLQTISPVTLQHPHHPDCLVACFQIEAEGDIEFSLHFRVPYWVQGNSELFICGNNTGLSVNDNGFICIRRAWKNGDTVKLVFRMGVTMSTIPGNDRLAAFHYGPLTLAALCEEPRTLVLPDSPCGLLVHDNEREWGNWKDTFRTVGQDMDLRFVPLKEIGYEPYSIYLPVK